MTTLTFLDTFTDAIRLLEEVVVVALATSVQEVFACSCFLVVEPAREGSLTGADDRSHGAGVCGGGWLTFNLVRLATKSHHLSPGLGTKAAISASPVNHGCSVRCLGLEVKRRVLGKAPAVKHQRAWRSAGA